jgi:protocatechuate 3,4-dioxygenase beta subunit
MKRKNFLKRGVLGLGTMLAMPTVLTACGNNGADPNDSTGCSTTPSETKGPFPIKTPSQLVQANIKSDRAGVALLMNITVQNKNNSCSPLAGVLVDVWHCDKDGDYSEYGSSATLHFLRGRQTTDANGKVSFLSVYPGWYNGRAPHIHVEVLSSSGSSLLVTQIAFPENVSSVVYASTLYSANGQANTSNASDNIFANSLSSELATVTGNLADGYTLEKIIVVNG